MQTTPQHMKGYTYKKLMMLLCIICTYTLISNTYALTTVRIAAPQTKHDKRFEHKYDVISTALKLTEAEYGSFTIKSELPLLQGKRMIDGVAKGDIINISIGPYNKDWDENTLTIPVPIRGGALSYRLLLIHKKDIERYQHVKTIEDLKNFNAGVLSTWATKELLQHQKLPTIDSNHYSGLFVMLNNHRFDYIARGIYEIFDELIAYAGQLNNIIIEPTLAIYAPTYTLVYVSPNYPKLAERLHKGLLLMEKNGDLKRIFNHYYGDSVKKSNIANRTILHLTPPPELTFITPLNINYVTHKTTQPLKIKALQD